ncbi:hypothetical protein [Microbacterium terrisoli]|uniref:hypothetical protein n=1 Tax=Microbacterium terrisoli TaxID=3242192 RepID=UPI0028048A31|nr:hypothetical protein [Microbacterium protaetiae]
MCAALLRDHWASTLTPAEARHDAHAEADYPETAQPIRRLPPERELDEKLGMSRGALREQLPIESESE